MSTFIRGVELNRDFTNADCVEYMRLFIEAAVKMDANPSAPNVSWQDEFEQHADQRLKTLRAEMGSAGSPHSDFWFSDCQNYFERRIAHAVLQMTIDGRSPFGVGQARPYDTSKVLMVRAIFTTFKDNQPHMVEHNFDWNNRAEVKNFAAQSDRIVREGGETLLKLMKDEV